VPDWREVGWRLKEMGPGAVYITLGSGGCQMVAARPLAIVPSPRVEAVDTVGAGDAFNGALAAGLAAGRSPGPELTAWANAAGALAVTQRGAQSALPDRDAIDRLSGLRSVR
jgi:ribokinase